MNKAAIKKFDIKMEKVPEKVCYLKQTGQTLIQRRKMLQDLQIFNKNKYVPMKMQSVVSLQRLVSNIYHRSLKFFCCWLSMD